MAESGQKISRRERQKQEREARILEAAGAIFARKGYHQATIREIAELADVADGTIYNYYNDKRDLLMAITRHVIAGTTASSLAAHEAEDDRAFITSILSERLAFVRENFEFTRALLSQVWTDDVFREQYLTEVIGPLLQVLEGYLRSRIDAGTVREVDTGVIVRAMVGSFLIFVLLLDSEEEAVYRGLSHDTLAQNLADFFLLGLEARGEAPGGA
jgi:AcrR family transcriptional regulator